MAKQCPACVRDNGFCVYCQKQYASPSRLHTHIKKAHQDTIRIFNCVEEADR